MLSDVVDQIENRGKQEGREEGREEGRRAAALRMLRKGYQTDEVVEITEFSHEEVAELAKQVDRERR